MTSFTRRIALKLLALGGTYFGVPRTGKADDKSSVSRTDAQSRSADRATSISWSRNPRSCLARPENMGEPYGGLAGC